MPSCTRGNLEARDAGFLHRDLSARRSIEKGDDARGETASRDAKVAPTAKATGDSAPGTTKDAFRSDCNGTGRGAGVRLVRRRSFDDATMGAGRSKTGPSWPLRAHEAGEAGSAGHFAPGCEAPRSRSSLPLRTRANTVPSTEAKRRSPSLTRVRWSSFKERDLRAGGRDAGEGDTWSSCELGAKGKRGQHHAGGRSSGRVAGVRQKGGESSGADHGDGETSFLQPLAGRCWFKDCRKVTVFRCRRCRQAYYCSRDHQREHWAIHRTRCKEGVGKPAPSLAYLALPPRAPAVPLRQQAKAVGWADSASFSRGAVSDGGCHTNDGGKMSAAGAAWSNERQQLWHSTSPASAAIAATGAILPAGGSKGALGSVSGANGGGVGTNDSGAAGAAGVAASGFKESGARLNALPSSTFAAEGTAPGFDAGVRVARGGTSWTVSGGGRGGGTGAGAGGTGNAGSRGGSAEVWPASSTASCGEPALGLGGDAGTVAAEAAAVARRRAKGDTWGRAVGSGTSSGGSLRFSRQFADANRDGEQVGASSSPSPLPPSFPPGLEPQIPGQAVRPLDDAAAAATGTTSFGPQLEMLTDMGFGRDQALRALRLSDGDVERAAEWLLTPHDDLAVCGIGIGMDSGGEAGGGGVGAGVGEVMYGPHCKPADHADGKLEWGGGTELEALSANETGGKHSGDRDDDDDLITNADPGDVGQGLDLRSFWVPEKVVGGGGTSAVTDAGGLIRSGDHGEWKGAVSFGKQHDEEHEREDGDEWERDLVTSYEDCVAGANADVLVFYRSSDAPDMLGGDGPAVGQGSASAMPSKAPAPVALRDSSCALEPAVPSAAIASAKCCASIHTAEDAALSALPLALARPGSLEAPSDTAIGSPAVTATATAMPAGTGVREDHCRVEEGDAGASGKPVLTIIVRPLPSTAPASLDSDSCTGEGADDRHDPSHDTEHVATLSWEEAEALAWDYQVAQQKLEATETTGGEAAASIPGTGTLDSGLFIDPSALPLPQAPPPLSPLTPPSSRGGKQPSEHVEDMVVGKCAAVASPAWRRKNKVGRMLTSMFRRRIDGGFEIVAPQDVLGLRYGASASAGTSRGEKVMARTRERPRGRSLPKLGRFSADVSTDVQPPKQQAALPHAFKWGTNAWSCRACTFLNEDPVFRTACEICRTERPRSGLGAEGNSVAWDLSSGPEHVDEVQVAGAGTKASGTSASAFFPASSVDPGNAATSVAGGEADNMPLVQAVAVSGIGGVPDGPWITDRGNHQGDDDDDAVDGILGGISPGGIASPPPPATALNGIDWEGGANWEGFGSTPFGESPVDFSPLRSGLSLGYTDEKSSGVDRDAGDGDCGKGSSASSADRGGNARLP